MPLIILGVALVGLLLVLIVLIPLSLVQRYRVGTARRLARGWVVALNLVTIALSAVLFLMVAAVTNTWVPGALRYALLGLAGGCLLGVLGLALTRWDPAPRTLHYTPNRWLVLGVTLVVTVRVLYGFWRGWQVWRYSPDETSWVMASGVAGSLAAGAVVLGYYLVFWMGVRRRLTRHLKAGGVAAGRRGWPTTRVPR
jgi:hypothetical protein